MSPVSTVVDAAALDWKVAAAGLGVFVGTVITTIWGALKARSELHKKIEGSRVEVTPSDQHPALWTGQLRDQFILSTHATERLVMALDNQARLTEDLIDEIRSRRTSIDSFTGRA